MTTDDDDRTYRKHMLEYSSSFVVRKGKDGVYSVLARAGHGKGQIYLHSISSNLLGAAFFGISGQFLKKIQTNPLITEILIECWPECVFIFAEENLPRLSGFLGVKRRMQLTNEQREVLRQRIKILREKQVISRGLINTEKALPEQGKEVASSSSGPAGIRGVTLNAPRA